MKKPELFIWSPSRASRFTRIEYPAFDDAGNTIDLFDGSPVADQNLNLIKSDKGKIPDFVYDVGLSLLVSEKAWGVIRRANVPGVRPYSATLWDKAHETECGNVWWLNVTSHASLLDRVASSFRTAQDGVFLREIAHFSIEYANVPDEDLFLCDEGSMKIFSRRLVDQIQGAGLTGARFRALQGATWP